MKDSSEWSRSGWPSEYHCPSKRLSWRAVSPMAFAFAAQAQIAAKPRSTLRVSDKLLFQHSPLGGD
jgi:hypothetical protein